MTSWHRTNDLCIIGPMLYYGDNLTDAATKFCAGQQLVVSTNVDACIIIMGIYGALLAAQSTYNYTNTMYACVHPPCFFSVCGCVMFMLFCLLCCFSIVSVLGCHP